MAAFFIALNEQVSLIRLTRIFWNIMLNLFCWGGEAE